MTQTWWPDADSHVATANPNSNYGGVPALVVSPNAGGPARSFVHFDLSSVPAGATIVEASLRICPVSVNILALGRVHDLHRVTSAWTENGVTWNTRPITTAAATDSHAVLAGLVCQTYEVTPDVQLWAAGSSNYGWQLSDAATNLINAEVNYGSRETADNSARPLLTVTFVP